MNSSFVFVMIWLFCNCLLKSLAPLCRNIRSPLFNNTSFHSHFIHLRRVFSVLLFGMRVLWGDQAAKSSNAAESSGQNRYEEQF